MNRIVIFYIKGEKYNPMYKWNDICYFLDDLRNGTNIPKEDDIVIEAYIDDNLIDMGNTFKETLEKMKFILDI